MTSVSRDEVGSVPGRRTDGGRGFPGYLTENDGPGRRFAPNPEALVDALDVVRALDADSYQALLWALGLTPDRRLSVPGTAPRQLGRARLPSGDALA